MFLSCKSAEDIVSERSLGQISDPATIGKLVERVLVENQEQVSAYLMGKEAIAKWLFGRVMQAAHGRANPRVVQSELTRQLDELK
jgi:aspartyl-tRNA(Asn)/glutamyl-tRNA(Gln) amidotransferase subunit B